MPQMKNYINAGEKKININAFQLPILSKEILGLGLDPATNLNDIFETIKNNLKEKIENSLKERYISNAI
jgi:hypothetical protein